MRLSGRRLLLHAPCRGLEAAHHECGHSVNDLVAGHRPLVLSLGQVLEAVQAGQHIQKGPDHECHPPVHICRVDLRQDLHESLHVAARREVINFDANRSEEHTSELQSLMRISYAVFCLKKKKKKIKNKNKNKKNIHNKHYYKTN